MAEAFATKGDQVDLHGHSSALLELPGEGHVSLAGEVSNPTECLAPRRACEWRDPLRDQQPGVLSQASVSVRNRGRQAATPKRTINNVPSWYV